MAPLLAGGGTVVFGVNNKAEGRAKTVLGVPRNMDVNRLKQAVYARKNGFAQRGTHRTS